MRLMSKFFSVFRLVFMERLIYRVNFILQIVSVILSSLIVVALWMAVYRSSSQTLLGGYSMAEMVTYILGGGLINSFILTTAENPETSQSIQDGSLSGILVQPISPYWVWFFRDLGTKTFLFLVGLAGYAVVFVFFRQYITAPYSALYGFYFAVSLLIAAILQFLIFESLSLLAFWLENTYGLRFTMRVIMEVAGGAIVPLSFFPDVLQKIFLALPFQYLIYLPMRIYLGKAPLSLIHGEFMGAFFWIAGLAVLNMILWKRGVQQYVAMGD